MAAKMDEWAMGVRGEGRGLRETPENPTLCKIERPYIFFTQMFFTLLR